MWSVYSRTLQQLARTNNFCEAFHSSLKPMIHNHPTIHKLILALKRENSKAKHAFKTFRMGINTKKSKDKYIKKDETYHNIIKQYHKDHIVAYLEILCNTDLKTN